jgi:arginyl-tRNA synthetase
MAGTITQKVPFYKDKTINLVSEDSWDKAKSIYPRLRSDVARILQVEFDQISIEKPKDTTNGDFSTSIALRLAKELSQSPRDFAQGAVEKLKTDTELGLYIEKVEIAGPGFINFTLKKEFVLESFVKAVNSSEALTPINILKGKRIMFEYAHPNPFKAFHIGHLRNIILGESLIRILEALGAEVIRTNYQGDVGMHIAKCLYAFLQIPESDYPTDVTARVALIAKCYAQGATAFADEKIQEEIKEINRKIYSKEDPKINNAWDIGKKWSLDKFAELYERVDSTFVRQYMESEVLDNCKKYVQEARDKGILIDSQGAVVFPGEKYGLDTRVFLNAQGLPTYEGKELGLAHMEFSDYGNIDLCIHNVAVEQISFFKVTFKVEALLDPAKYEGKQYHNAYEFVGLKSGKMSSRTGNVVLGEDIINEAVKRIGEIVSDREGLDELAKAEISEIVGVGAIKYSFLNIGPGSYLAFDLEKSLQFDGNSGPYLQYTYARANRILKDSGDLVKSTATVEMYKQYELTDIEYGLMKKLNEFDNVVIEAGKNLAPNIIATYLFDLAQTFSAFYKAVKILNAENAQQRVLLTKQLAAVMAKGLNLMGIKTSEVM